VHCAAHLTFKHFFSSSRSKCAVYFTMYYSQTNPLYEAVTSKPTIQ